MCQVRKRISLAHTGEERVKKIGLAGGNHNYKKGLGKNFRKFCKSNKNSRILQMNQQKSSHFSLKSPKRLPEQHALIKFKLSDQESGFTKIVTNRAF